MSTQTVQKLAYLGSVEGNPGKADEAEPAMAFLSQRRHHRHGRGIGGNHAKAAFLKLLLSHHRRHGRGIGGNHAKAAFLK
jgi:hypothetical protein